MSRGEGSEDIPLSGVGLQHRGGLPLLLLHLHNGEAGLFLLNSHDEAVDDDDDEDDPHGWVGIRLDVGRLGGVCSCELLRKLLLRRT